MSNAKLSRRGLLMVRKAQQGVALVVALLLLILIAIVGLAAIRGTVIQQRMASNTYDRQLAFQAAEAALRIAASNITSNTTSSSFMNCGSGGLICQANPFNDSKVGTSNIVTVSTSQFQGTSAAAQPQFVIQYLGSWVSASAGTGFGQSANSNQYGAQGGSVSTPYYRVTARSADPSQVSNRAVVTLQAVIKQG
jgi:type IV pilus assembly protein PilX